MSHVLAAEQQGVAWTCRQSQKVHEDAIDILQRQNINGSTATGLL